MRVGTGDNLGPWGCQGASGSAQGGPELGNGSVGAEEELSGACLGRSTAEHKLSVREQGLKLFCNLELPSSALSSVIIQHEELAVHTENRFSC